MTAALSTIVGFCHIPEKFNVVTGSHDVFVEFGNVGTKFSYIAPEGFDDFHCPRRGVSLRLPHIGRSTCLR